MRRSVVRIAALSCLIGAIGCNRQDADALANIGHILVERAKTLPVNKPAAIVAPSLPAPADSDEQNHEKN